MQATCTTVNLVPLRVTGVAKIDEARTGKTGFVSWPLEPRRRRTVFRLERFGHVNSIEIWAGSLIKQANRIVARPRRMRPADRDVGRQTFDGIATEPSSSGYQCYGPVTYKAVQAGHQSPRPSIRLPTPRSKRGELVTNRRSGVVGQSCAKT